MDDLSAELDGTWTRHVATQLRRVANQESAIVGLLASTLDETASQLAAGEAHKLAGSLGSFGLEEASEIAGELEAAWQTEDPWSLDAAALARKVARLRRLIDEHTPAASAADGSPEPATTGEGIEVLLVDDDETFADQVVEMLRPFHAVSWIADGQSALATLTAPAAGSPPRLILLDIEMPGMDGLAVLEALSRAGITRQCSVVMLTRRTLAEDIVKARKLGACDFLAKPLSSALLVDRVERALQSAARP